MQASPSLSPGDQGQDWRRRWQDIQNEGTELLRPLTSPLSTDAIQAARSQVQAFYVTAYHLKDDLIAASPNTGISPKTIEKAVTQDTNLALLCDLANLTKHRQLRKPPRSGHSPRIRHWAGTGSPSGTGWHLALTIEHNGRTIDGLDMVQRAIDAWQLTLHAWQLI